MNDSSRLPAVTPVPVTDVHELRRLVLRTGTPSNDVTLPNDELATTRHFGIRDESGAVIATSSWSEAESPDRPGLRALQLRGMAVHPDHQRRGLGVLLVDAGIAHATAEAIPVVWANARDTALDFYRSVGFTVVGDGFLTADTRLPHHRIVRDR